MNPLNKFEAIGIFASVAVMALALSMLRFMTSPETGTLALEGTTQQGSLIVAGDETSNGGTGIENALKNAMTPDGELGRLVIDDVRIGTGARVEKGDTVVVDYIGTTQDGIRFDSSYERGTPFTFTLGGGRVIEGWEKGLVGMQVGGQRILVIPPAMAYGNKQVGPIPPNSPLVFAIELREIQE